MNFGVHHSCRAERRTDYWRVFGCMAHRLWWAVLAWMLFGWLDRSGQRRRDLAREISALEHGIRCILLVMRRKWRPAPRPDFVERLAQRGPDAGDAKAADGSRRVARFACLTGAFGGDDGAGCLVPPIPGSAGTSPVNRGRGGRDCCKARELSAPACGGSAPERGEGGTQAHPHPQRKPTPHALLSRINAILHVLEDVEPYAMRMARALKRAGIRLRAFNLRPVGAPPDARRLAAALLGGHAPGPAICDST